jgi:hypothetical protein
LVLINKTYDQFLHWNQSDTGHYFRNLPPFLNLCLKSWIELHYMV